MTKQGIVLVNVGGFEVVIPSTASSDIDYSSIAIDKWTLILIPNRSMGFTHYFKILVDTCGKGLWFSRTRFYEQWDKPIEMLMDIVDPRTIILLKSNPHPYRLAYRMVKNPRYSSVATLVARIYGKKDVPQWIFELIKIAHRLYIELSPIVLTRGYGKLVGLKIVREHEKDKDIAIGVCIDREHLAPQKISEVLDVSIMGINRCLEI